MELDLNLQFQGQKEDMQSKFCFGDTYQPLPIEQFVCFQAFKALISLSSITDVFHIVQSYKLKLICGLPGHPSQGYSHWRRDITLQISNVELPKRVSISNDDRISQASLSESPNDIKLTKMQAVEISDSIWRRRFNARRKQLGFLYSSMSQTKNTVRTPESEALLPQQRLNVHPLWERRLHTRKKQLDHFYDSMSTRDISSVHEDANVQQTPNEKSYAVNQIDSPSSDMSEYLTFSTAETPADSVAMQDPEDEVTYATTSAVPEEDQILASDVDRSGLFSVGLLMAEAHPHITQAESQQREDVRHRQDKKGIQRSIDLENIEKVPRRNSSLIQDIDSYVGEASSQRRSSEEGSNSGRYSCPHSGCVKAFARPFHVRRHILTHGNNKPCTCPHKGCQARFTRSDNCAQHQRAKHGFRIRFKFKRE
jgi:hypothetical protein